MKNNICKFRIGNPINTDAVVTNLTAEKGKMPYLKKEGNSFIYKLGAEDRIYGLGVIVRGINK